MWILLSEAVSGLSGRLTRDGAKLYSQSTVQPPLSPPLLVFPVVRAILFALMGVGAARFFPGSPTGLPTASAPESGMAASGRFLCISSCCLSYCSHIKFKFKFSFSFYIPFFQHYNCILKVSRSVYFTNYSYLPPSVNGLFQKAGYNGSITGPTGTYLTRTEKIGRIL